MLVDVVPKNQDAPVRTTAVEPLFKCHGDPSLGKCAPEEAVVLVPARQTEGARESPTTSGYHRANARASGKAVSVGRTPPVRPVAGFVDGVLNGHVVGWALWPSDRAERVPVRVVADGEVVAEAVADEQRPDLAERGIDAGTYGFEISLPEFLQLRSRVILEVLANDGMRVPMSPNFWTRADPGAEWAGVEFVAAAASAGPESPDLRALVQGVSNGRVIGHALRRSAPEQRLELEVVVDGDVVARGPADVFRPALLDEKLADGSCGFSIELPDSLQGAACLRILVREAVSHTQLPVSPHFWCETPSGSSWDGLIFEPMSTGSAERSAESPPPQVLPQRGPRLAVIGPDGWLLDSWDFDPLPGANPIGDLVRQLRQTA